MLYLLKGSRVREYHQQNVAILGAPEGEVIEVAYNRRWVQEGISLEPGTDCAIVFGDSPYEYFVPIRFAALLRAEETDSRVTVVCKLGPFVRRGALEPLNERWNRPDRPLRPGDVFLFEDRNPGLVSPRGLAETEDAWRAAVDALRHNDFYERTSVARLHSVIGEGGRPVDDGQPVPVGSVVKATLEVRSPHLADEQLELLLDVDPRGAVELLDDPVVPANGMAELSMRVTASGPLSVGLAFSHEPLLSSRPRFDLVAESRERAPTVPAERHGVGDVSGVRSLTARLRRDADIDDATWVGLYQDIFLEWAPDDPVLLASYARHAYAVGEYDECYRALERIPQRVPDDDYLFLLASLRTGRTTDLAELIQRIDLKEEERFEQFLAAVDGIAQDPLHELLNLLPNKLLGEGKTIRFLDRAWKQVTDIELACRIAEDTAYADPERGAALLLDRWPDPAAMPAKALALVIDWEARTSRLGPYVETAVARAMAANRWDELKLLTDKVRRLVEPRRRPQVLAQIGEHLLSSGDPARAREGFGLVCEAAHSAATRGQLDIAADHAEVAVGHAQTSGDDELVAAALQLKEAVETAIQASETFQAWQRMREESAIERLAPRFRGKALHLVGGKRRDWADLLRDGLGLVELRWHETEKAKSTNVDWASGLEPERDVVVVITDQIGHDTTTALKQRCDAREVPYLHGSSRLRDVLEALERIGDDRRPEAVG
mgnify:FL=1